jgi:hypothetical protein
MPPVGTRLRPVANLRRAGGCFGSALRPWEPNHQSRWRHQQLSEKSTMSAVKHAFEKMGHGLEHAASSLGKDVKGLGHVVDGVLTMNPKEIKNGFSEVGNGLKQGIDGLGEAAGGVAGGLVGMTPLGAGINALTHNSLTKICEGVGNACASTLDSGIDGVGQVAKGVATGNFKEMAKGAFNIAQVASLAVPGAGEAEAAADIALAAGKAAAKHIVKDGVEQQVIGNVH